MNVYHSHHVLAYKMKLINAILPGQKLKEMRTSHTRYSTKHLPRAIKMCHFILD